MAFTVPPLPYAFDALEPYIDKQTMEIHHDKHHGAYVTNLNKALESAPDLQSKTVEELLANNCAIVPENIRPRCATTAAATSTTPCSGRSSRPAPAAAPPATSRSAINSAFGSFDTFKEKFGAAATGRFGSGWAWLIKSSKGVEIISTANQDSPVMEGHFPVMGLDVWEHAYYLKYQNRRPEYIAAWWSVVNWPEIEKRFNSAK